VSVIPDYYEVLQVSPNASKEVIEAAYRRLAKIHHPDVGGNETTMKEINEAYESLIDPVKREGYDILRKSHYSSTQQDSYNYYGETNAVIQVRPWVRFGARYIDLSLGALCFFILFNSFSLYQYIPSYFYDKSDFAYAFLMSICFISLIFLEAFCLSTFGTTPGKWLLREELITINGDKITFKKAIKRTIHLWLTGLGLGIPVISLFTILASYSRLKGQGETAWDEKGGFIVRHKRIGYVRGITAIVILIVVIYFANY